MVMLMAYSSQEEARPSKKQVKSKRVKKLVSKAKRFELMMIAKLIDHNFFAAIRIQTASKMTLSL